LRGLRIPSMIPRRHETNVRTQFFFPLLSFAPPSFQPSRCRTLTSPPKLNPSQNRSFPPWLPAPPLDSSLSPIPLFSWISGHFVFPLHICLFFLCGVVVLFRYSVLRVGMVTAFRPVSFHLFANIVSALANQKNFEKFQRDFVLVVLAISSPFNFFAPRYSSVPLPRFFTTFFFFDFCQFISLFSGSRTDRVVTAN